MGFASHPEAPVLIIGIPNFLDVAEIYCVEESGQSLNNFDKVHLVPKRVQNDVD